MNRLIALISGLLITALSFSIFPQGKPAGHPTYVIDALDESDNPVIMIVKLRPGPWLWNLRQT